MRGMFWNWRRGQSESNNPAGSWDSNLNGAIIYLASFSQGRKMRLKNDKRKETCAQLQGWVITVEGGEQAADLS